MKISFTADQLKGTVRLPSSKSLSNRALMIQAYAGTPLELINLSAANDTVLLKRILDRIALDPAYRIIDVEDAGTPFRFLLSFLAKQPNREFVLKGSERLHQRPINDLVDALCSLGASIDYLGEEGFAPLLIHGRELRGGEVHIRAGASSQFISSLCLLAPVLSTGLDIRLSEQVVSDTYISMTLGVMRHFGIESAWHGSRIVIAQQAYHPARYVIESDWSSACFFYAMAMLHDETALHFPNLSPRSLQGDAAIAAFAEEFGVITSEEGNGLSIRTTEIRVASPQRIYHLGRYPDLAVPLIVAFALRYPEKQISGIGHLEWKESRRITVLQYELAKLGMKLAMHDETLTFQKGEPAIPGTDIPVHVSGDHRIAMAMTLAALIGYPLVIDDPLCVKKSFPDFFSVIKALGFTIITT